MSMKSFEYLLQGLVSAAVALGSFGGVTAAIQSQPTQVSQTSTVSYQCSEVPKYQIVWASRNGVSGGLVKSKPGAREDTYFIPMGNDIVISQYSRPTKAYPHGRIIAQKRLDELKLSKSHPKVEVTFRDQYFKLFSGKRHYSFVHIFARWGHDEFRPHTYGETVTTCLPE